LGIYISGDLRYNTRSYRGRYETDYIGEEQAKSFDAHLPFHVSGEKGTMEDRIKNAWLRERKLVLVLNSGFDFFFVDLLGLIFLHRGGVRCGMG